MKRDMDLIRELLLVIEADESPHGWDVSPDAIGTYSEAQVHHHLEILQDAGFISIQHDDWYIGGGRSMGGIRMRWPGHEFLGDIRNDTVWKQTKETVLEKVGSVSVTVMGELARHLARGLVGL